MTGRTGGLWVVVTIHTVWHLGDVGIVDQATVGGDMALVTLVVWFSNWAGARNTSGMTTLAGDIVSRCMIVVGEGCWPGDIMAAGAGWCRAVTGVTVTGSCRDMRIMGYLAVLVGMAGVTGVVRLNDRCGARCTGGMAALTSHIVCRGMIVMGKGGGSPDIMAAGTGRCLAMAGVAVAGRCRDVAVVGELSVLGGMAVVT